MGKDKSGLFREKLAWLPVLLFTIAIGVLYKLDIQGAAESYILVTLLNLFFCAPAAFFACYLAARSYTIVGDRYLLFMGSGMLAWGLSTSLIAMAGSNVNTLLTIHNTGVYLASLGSLISAVLASIASKIKEDHSWVSERDLGISYVGITVFMMFIAWGASLDLLPLFFVPGHGATMIRQFVLGAAVVQFFIAAVIFRILYARLKVSFFHWYSLGLILIDAGLLGVWLTLPGTSLNWTARAAQLLAGPYIIIAIFSVRHRLRDWRIPLEKALYESEERYKLLFENMTEAFALHEIICDKKGVPVDYRFIDVNPAFEKVTGLKREKIIGRRVLEVLPDTEAYWMETYGKVALSGAPAHFERYSVRLGRWYEVFAYRPALNQFAVTFTDVTERKQVEEGLRKNEEELKKLNRILKALSGSSQAMVRSNNEAEYLREICNIIIMDCGHAMVWIGYAEQDEAKTVLPVAQAGFEEGYLKTVNITWQDTERGRGPTGTAIRTGKPSICRNMLTDPNFAPWREEAIKRGYASSIVLPLISSENTLGAINIYSKDPDPFTEKEVQLLCELTDDVAYGITALRLRAENVKAQEILKRDKDAFERLVQEKTTQLVEAKMELEKSKRLSDIGVLAATVAHELRNPLAAIIMAAHNIKRKANNPDLDKHLANIDKKVAESDQIINNLLFYSRLKPPNYEIAGIFDILEESIESIDHKNKKNISIIRSIDPLKGISVEIDPIQIREVINNIMNNAYDAVPPRGGRIRVMAESENEFIKVAIEDNGSGISKDDLDKVFDPFFTTKAEGTGLGLSVCRQIVDFHRGSIFIESEVGKGTSVIVRLPKKE